MDPSGTLLWFSFWPESDPSISTSTGCIKFNQKFKSDLRAFEASNIANLDAAYKNLNERGAAASNSDSGHPHEVQNAQALEISSRMKLELDVQSRSPDDEAPALNTDIKEPRDRERTRTVQQLEDELRRARDKVVQLESKLHARKLLE